MISLAVVEDELVMRKFLLNCIDYQELNISICGDYCCAEDALMELENIKPDIVVTDIKMTGMNGIEFMSKLLEKSDSTRFVVVSNYQDFQYVREAFKIGIFDYISKSDFEVDYYKKVLQNIASTMGTIKKQYTFSDSRKILKETFWSKSLNKDFGEYNFSLDPDNIYMAVIDILNYDNNIRNEWDLDKELLKYGLTNYLRETIDDLGSSEFFFNEYDQIIILSSVKEISLLNKYLNNLIEFFYKEMNFFVTVCAFTKSYNIQELKNRYFDLRDIAKYRFFLENNSIITHEILSEFKDYIDCNSLLENFEKLFSEAQFNTVIKKIDELAKLKPRLESIEDTMIVYRTLYRMLRQFDSAHNIGFITSDIVENLIEIGNCKQVCEYYIKVVKTFSDYTSNDGILMKKIDNYVQEHFAEDITLEQMSGFFNYEYNYFSKVFQKYKGVSFKKYLVNVRLSEAMNLLLHSDLKCSDISEKVGYKNYEHFSRSFKNKYGKSPSEINRERDYV